MTIRTNSPKIIMVRIVQIKICSAFGHREVFENISERITTAVIKAVEQGCEIFYTGSMGEFDNLFSAAVRKVQKNYPYIKLICVKPYQTKELIESKDYYGMMYNDVIIPQELLGVHFKAAIKKRNRWIIDHSDIVLIYTIRNYGGAYEAEKYSLKKKKSIIYISI